MKDWLLLLLRLSAGIGLAYWAGHGKVFEPDLRQAYSDLLQDSGIPAAPLITILFGVIEFFGSMFLAAGFFTRQAAGLLLVAGLASAAIQLLAFDAPASHLFTFQDIQGLGTGYYLIAFAAVIMAGPGRISFDAGRRTIKEG
ncbi:MAG: DoxX family protein [Planctomycetota bacterium]|jgi:uncharacterized membrane protein YphA (DoxX/SURF4 family)